MFGVQFMKQMVCASPFNVISIKHMLSRQISLNRRFPLLSTSWYLIREALSQAALAKWVQKTYSKYKYHGEVSCGHFLFD